MARIPAPLKVPWTMKSVDTAETTVSRLPDGRTQYAIKHDLLRGVTPRMIVWYLNHMTDLITVAGETVQRYRMWHPRDHISLTYLKPALDGRNFGKGAQVRIQEAFNAEPRYRINIKANVEFLDETGFAHVETVAGLTIARVDYTFTETDEGTLYEDVLTAGCPGRGPLARFINYVIQPRVFPERRGLAWIRHNVEEVGNFEFFLPEMYGDA